MLWLLIFAAYTVRDEVSAPELWQHPAQPSDEITVGERRFDELRRTFKPGDQLGYLSDLNEASSEGIGARYMAQYSLAPVLLVSPVPGQPVPRQPVPSETPEFVLGNFGNPAAGPAVARNAGLTVVRDFGSGVWLLRRAPR